MKKRKLVWLWIIALASLISQVNALTLRTIRWKTNSEVPNEHTMVTGEGSIFGLIKLVNNYLRLAVGFVCFLFMVINGYKLITANGDEKQSKAATTALIWSVVWIVICLLAYIIVNLAVKLFA